MAKRGSSGLSLMLAIDKPKGLSSHDVVNRCRRIFGERRIGHTGTLDPLASGVLCVAVGPATRLDAYLSGHEKTYVMDIAFGASTTTDDAEGEIVSSGTIPEELALEEFAQGTVASLVGAGKQLPPVYSAVKVGGQKSYAAARAGNVIDLKPRDFEVFEARLDTVSSCKLADLLEDADSRFGDGDTAGANLEREVVVWRVTMRVSGGTYMRSIARDLGKRFGCGAFVSNLVRSALDSATLEECATLDQLDVDPFSAQIDPLRLLNMRYAFVRDELQIKAVENGSRLSEQSLSLKMPIPECPYDEYCCTTQVFPSDEPATDGELVALLVDNRIKALYRFDSEKQCFVSQCVFSVGVSRGSNL